MSGFTWSVLALAGLLILFVGNQRRWLALKNRLLAVMERRPVYGRQDAMFTAAEINFYRTLHKAAPDYIVMGKVRVADLLKVHGGLASASEKRTAFNRITGKHVDFVLLEQNTMRPLCALELDDKSHQKRARRERDDFLNKAFKEAGLPLLRIPCAAGYQQDVIRNLIVKAASASLADLQKMAGTLPVPAKPGTN